MDSTSAGTSPYPLLLLLWGKLRDRGGGGGWSGGQGCGGGGRLAEGFEVVDEGALPALVPPGGDPRPEVQQPQALYYLHPQLPDQHTAAALPVVGLSEEEGGEGGDVRLEGVALAVLAHVDERAEGHPG